MIELLKRKPPQPQMLKVVLLAVELDMSPATWAVTIIASAGFLIMFGLASAKGDFQGLIRTTLENDKLNRKKK